MISLNPDGPFCAEEVSMALELVQLCWLCGTRVSLDDCKIDEHGEAAQEKCYVSKLALSGAVLPL